MRLEYIYWNLSPKGTKIILAITRIIEFEFDSVFASGDLLSYRAYFNILLPHKFQSIQPSEEYEVLETLSDTDLIKFVLFSSD